MAVIITNTSGDTVATLSDATLNRTAAPIVLVGRGYGGFTKVLNEDLYRILENFASAAAPQNPVPGMIWYSSETLSMQYYNGTSWSNFSGGTTQTFLQTSPPTNPADDLIVGDLWFDTDDGNHPYRWSGTAWVSFRDLSYEAAVAESADNAYQTALDRIAVTAYATATSSDRIAVAADKATVSQAKSDVLDAQAEINQKVVQANAAATAAANSAASAAVSAPVYAYADRETANDSVSNGQRFRISGADGTGVYEYIRVGADFSTATLVTDWAGANAVSSLTTRVTDVEGIKSNVKSALSPKGVAPSSRSPDRTVFAASRTGSGQMGTERTHTSIQTLPGSRRSRLHRSISQGLSFPVPEAARRSQAMAESSRHTIARGTSSARTRRGRTQRTPRERRRLVRSWSPATASNRSACRRHTAVTTSLQSGTELGSSGSTSRPQEQPPGIRSRASRMLTGSARSPMASRTS